jgi:hypothetical protein
VPTGRRSTPQPPERSSASGGSRATATSW